MSKNLAAALALVAAIGTTTEAAACGTTPCGGTTTPTTPGLNVTTNSPTAYGGNASAGATANAGAVAGAAANNTNNIGVKNENINNVTGGASNSSTSNSGNSTNNNTTVYEARRIPVATAIGATASAAFADGCAMSGRGFGLGVQTIGVGLSGNMSGAKIWNDDSQKCHAAALETAIVQKGGTPADSAAALLTASEKSPAVANAVQKLQSAEGQTLMGLFAVPAVAAPVAQPAVTNVYNITNKDVPAQPKALKLGE